MRGDVDGDFVVADTEPLTSPFFFAGCGNGGDFGLGTSPFIEMFSVEAIDGSC